MKKILFFSFYVAFIGCNHKEAIIHDAKFDSLMVKTDMVLAHSDSTHRVNDSITTKAVDEATKNFEHLTKEIEQVKSQKIKSVQKEKIIYRVDTIYVETKKNFWGKTKTNVKQISDSTTTNTSDSTETIQ